MPDASDRPQPLGERPDLPQLLELVRALMRELARRKASPLITAREDASDLAQSVVLELLRAKDRIDYRGPAATTALAREILVRLLSDKLRALRTHKRDARRELRLPTGDDSAATTPVPATRKGTGPFSRASNRELIELGNRRLAQLSERERDVLARRDAGQSHREIAQALGISEEYSQRLLSDARKKLRGDADS